MARIIGVFSREGGTGKTTIALSAAIQLAFTGRKGRKVAFVDIGVEGTLSECLPASRCFTLEEGRVKMTGAEDPSVCLPKKPYFSFGIFGVDSEKKRMLQENGCWPWDKNPLVEAAKEHLLLPKGIRVQRGVEGLSLFPMSPFLTDKDRVIDVLFRYNGIERCQGAVEELISQLEAEGYEDIVIDNDSSTSYTPGCILTLLAQEKYRERENVHLWLVSGPRMANLSFLAYEWWALSLEHSTSVLFIRNKMRNDGGKSVLSRETLFGGPFWCGTKRRLGEQQEEFLRNVRTVRWDPAVEQWDQALSATTDVQSFYPHFFIPALQGEGMHGDVRHLLHEING